MIIFFHPFLNLMIFSLAKLIFHELTHTIFFIDGDVDFNESLAQYIGRQLAIEYFKFDAAKMTILKQNEGRSRRFRYQVTRLVNDYNNALKNSRVNSKQEALAILEKIYLDKHEAKIRELCVTKINNKCAFDIKKWNNARMAEYLTYEQGTSLIETLQQKKKLSLKELLMYVVNMEKEFNYKQKFSTYIKEKENL